MLSGQGDERVSNSYAPRVRHAFFTYNNWLFGQTWMTFFNVGALPENLDFVGPAESTVFGRQADDPLHQRLLAVRRREPGNHRSRRTAAALASWRTTTGCPTWWPLQHERRLGQLHGGRHIA